MRVILRLLIMISWATCSGTVASFTIVSSKIEVVCIWLLMTSCWMLSCTWKNNISSEFSESLLPHLFETGQTRLKKKRSFFKNRLNPNLFLNILVSQIWVVGHWHSWTYPVGEIFEDVLEDEIRKIHPVSECVGLLLGQCSALELLLPEPSLPLFAVLKVTLVSLFDDIRRFLLVIIKLQ